MGLIKNCKICFSRTQVFLVTVMLSNFIMLCCFTRPVTSNFERCSFCPPTRPPKPLQLIPSQTSSPFKKKSKKPPMPLPTQQQPPTCSCIQKDSTNYAVNPYDNYDVPKNIALLKVSYFLLEGNYFNFCLLIYIYLHVSWYEVCFYCSTTIIKINMFCCENYSYKLSCFCNFIIFI